MPLWPAPFRTITMSHEPEGCDMHMTDDTARTASLQIGLFMNALAFMNSADSPLFG
jgi:hypothetical protein